MTADPNNNEQLKQLMDDVNTTASQDHKVYLTFLSFQVYIAVIIGSTTDEQLLRISPVILPILNIGIPIRWFYVLIPWFLLLLHFNLLLQLTLLAGKLHLLDETIGAFPDAQVRKAQRTQLSVFPFARMLIGTHHGRLLRVLLALIVWLTILLLPLVLLVGAHLRFLPDHSPAITLSQQVVVVADLVLLWSFWPMIMGPGGSARAWWARIVTRPVHWAQQLWTLTRAVGWWCIRRRTRPQVEGDELGPSETPGHPKRARGFLALTVTSSLVIAILVFLWQNWGALKQIGLSLEEKTLVAGTPSMEVLSALQSEDEAIRQNALQKVMGLSLEGRDLRYAKFRKATLPKADLRGADLDGANLDGANLDGANLHEASLYEANLVGASLRGANLEETNLEKANLEKANLDGASLHRATLNELTIIADKWRLVWRIVTQGAPEEDLRGANLEETNLEKANLEKANLGGANLRGANLRGANLDGANLDGANLDGANLHEASLGEANLEGANLHEIDLEETNLVGANLRGTDLRLTLYLRPSQLNEACMDDKTMLPRQLSPLLTHRSEVCGKWDKKR